MFRPRYHLRYESLVRYAPPDEQDRRKAFSAALAVDYEAFKKLPLSTARNVSMHRRGFADVVVSFKSFFGVIHVGSPVKQLPIAESRPAEIGGELSWLHTPLPLRPNWKDFSIDGKPLFDEGQKYLLRANALVQAARSNVQVVHGSAPLTLPP